MSGVQDKPTVLIVDDEPDLVELVDADAGAHEPRDRVGRRPARRAACSRPSAFDLCLTDMRLPDGDGLDLVAWIQAQRRGCRSR